jgi:hypothetical protein
MAFLPLFNFKRLIMLKRSHKFNIHGLKLEEEGKTNTQSLLPSQIPYMCVGSSIAGLTTSKKEMAGCYHSWGHPIK